MSKAAELANLIGNINAGGGGVNRNIIINGAMNVAQRGTSSTGVGASSGYFTCDRWRIAANTSGRLTMTQDSSVPSGKGFANSLKLACTTTDTSLGADELVTLNHRIEGQNLQGFSKGTSDAKPFAVSFYVKGNASATYVLEMQDNDNDRQISKSFNVTTDWTKVTLNFPADTTGAFDDDNAQSMQFQIWINAGSSYTSGTINSSAWASTTNANRVGSGTTNFFDSTDRTFFITGVQLEVGQNPTIFEHEPFGVTLDKCERYYMRTGINGGNGAIASGYVHTSSEVRYSLRFRKEMRSAPSLTFLNSSAFFLQDRADNRTPSGFAAYSGKDFTLIVANHSGANVGEGSNLLSGGSSEIQCSAEL
jgi:hypothetical protein